MSAGSFLVSIGAVVSKLAGAYTVPGWTSILFVVSFVGGVNLIVVGMIGLYVGRIYDEVKQRPLYVVRTLRGLDEEDSRLGSRTASRARAPERQVRRRPRAGAR